MIGYLEHHIVDHCNLNCAGCSHFSSLVEEPWFEDLDKFKEDFLTLAVKTKSKVDCIRLMGGEPLLHPQYPEFLQFTRITFPNSNIQIVTNGLLLKKEHDRLVDICNQYDIQVCVSNYNLNLNLDELLKDFKYTRVDPKGSLYNICLNLNENIDSQVAFDNCDLHVNKWYYFQYGRFYPCCISANFHYFDKHFNLDLIDWNEDDVSISIYNHSIQEIKEFLNKPIPLCKYCDTISRPQTYHSFSKTQRRIEEWICQ